MSYKRILICDECYKPIHVDVYKSDKDYQVGYTHMCHTCQMIKYGFIISIVEIQNNG